MNSQALIAYFSMEIAVNPEIPTYSGGLGVLAGDTIRSAADMKVPMLAVTLLYRKGYFYQKLDSTGWQTEEPINWVVKDLLKKMEAKVQVTIEGRTVYLQAWKYDVVGIGGCRVPVYFLDADLPENSEWDRKLTYQLYGGDKHYRLCQEVILGIGGVRMLRELGYNNIMRFHMNEGHAALLTLEILDEHIAGKGKRIIEHEDVEEVKKNCVFTTHTPVSSGHDQFSMDLVRRVIGNHQAFDIKEIFCCDNVLNMTYLAMNLSHYVNGVAKRHGEISRQMFPNYVIDAITNGVHVATWTSEPFQELFNHYIPGWREDNTNLRYAQNIPKKDIWTAHKKMKHRLIKYVNHETNAGMDIDHLTLGFARRATGYKRVDLLFEDIERLKKIRSNAGPIQVIYAGKAHPRDQEGKKLIKKIYRMKEILKQNVKIAYLENYDMELGKLMTSGVDVWLNTPHPPMEASGTSGMKAALNGVPSLSILDGWWMEGCVEGLTGWAIGEKGQKTEDNSRKDAELLYSKLEKQVIPAFYQNHDHFINIMIHTIALNGSFFNTQRMIQQYVLKAYFL